MIEHGSEDEPRDHHISHEGRPTYRDVERDWIQFVSLTYDKMEATEYARYLNGDRNRVYRLLKTNKIEGAKVNGRWWVTRASGKRYLQSVGLNED